MAMVPMVSAEDNSQIATEITDKDIQAIFDSAYGSLPAFHDEKTKTVYLEEYVSPAQKAIDLMESKQYSKAQITAILEKNGYGWNPDTGACWKGTAPTDAEQSLINKIRGEDYSPFDREEESQKLLRHIDDWRQEYRQLKTVSGSTFYGVNDYMKPGQMVTSSSGTTQHVVTTHVGRRPNPSTECWTEAGVADSIADPQRRYFTYDNDEGGWSWHGNAGATTTKNYEIYVTSTLESAGYTYHIWIDGAWVRTGHLAYRENFVDQANEIWADGSNAFSSDPSISEFRDSTLYRSSGNVKWATNVATEFNHVGTAISESRVVSGNAYDWQMWIP